MTAARYGPVSMPAIWEHAYQEPIYLVTNLSDLDAAVQLYRKRAHIETFFSDQKSRGFHIHKSHLCAPARLSRLLIASCLAYLWIVYLGVCAMRDDWMYRLCGENGYVIVSMSDLAVLALESSIAVEEQVLRVRIQILTNCSLREAIHAMLDQEEPRTVISVQPWSL
jgi:hypothetical protein